jgi:hypothetical protein
MSKQSNKVFWKNVSPVFSGTVVAKVVLTLKLFNNVIKNKLLLDRVTNVS